MWMTFQKIVDLISTYGDDLCKMQQMEKEELAKLDQTDGNQWSRFEKCSEVLDHEKCWITYAEQALSLLNHEVVWQGIVEACKILKYPEPSAMHRHYFETLFDMSCSIWFQIYSESKRTECISNLIGYIICVCTLKFISTGCMMHQANYKSF